MHALLCSGCILLLTISQAPDPYASPALWPCSDAWQHADTDPILTCTQTVNFNSNPDFDRQGERRLG